MTEWLKENMWPREQVTDYMQETAVYRAQWIRNNEAKTVPDIIAEFPRLVDTPGMVRFPGCNLGYSKPAGFNFFTE